MTVGELMARIGDLPPETPVCVAELEEAFAMNAARAEVVEDARIEGRAADGREAVDLSGGADRVVLIRW